MSFCVAPIQHRLWKLFFHFLRKPRRAPSLSPMCNQDGLRLEISLLACVIFCCQLGETTRRIRGKWLFWRRKKATPDIQPGYTIHFGRVLLPSGDCLMIHHLHTILWAGACFKVIFVAVAYNCVIHYMLIFLIWILKLKYRRESKMYIKAKY